MSLLNICLRSSIILHYVFTNSGRHIYLRRRGFRCKDWLVYLRVLLLCIAILERPWTDPCCNQSGILISSTQHPWPDSGITFIVFFQAGEPLRWKEINTHTHRYSQTIHSLRNSPRIFKWRPPIKIMFTCRPGGSLIKPDWLVESRKVIGYLACKKYLIGQTKNSAEYWNQHTASKRREDPIIT